MKMMTGAGGEKQITKKRLKEGKARWKQRRKKYKQ